MNRKQSAKANQYLDRLTDLPPAPTVATELLGLFGDPNTDIVQVVETIRHDPSLTAKLLKMSNSAYYSGPEPFTDMFEIVTRLGFYEVYCAVAALVAASAMTMAKAGAGVDANSLWRHSVTSAVAASKLAKRAGDSEAEAFTAGLLHDIGKLVFAAAEGRKYGDVVKMAEVSGTSLQQTEEVMLGLDHAHVGAELLLRWGLPKDIALAVKSHNDLATDGEPLSRLTAIVQLASDLARQIVREDFGSRGSLPYHEDAIKSLGLTAEDIPTLLAEIRTGLSQVAGLSMANS